MEPEEKKLKLMDANDDSNLNPWWRLDEPPLIKIFDLLDVDDLKIVRLICQRWSKVVEDTFLKRSALVLERCQVRPTCPPWTVLAQTKLKFLNVKIGRGIKCEKSLARAFFKLFKNDIKNCYILPEKRILSVDKLLMVFNNLSSVNFANWNQLKGFNIPQTVEKLEFEEMPTRLSKEEKEIFDRIMARQSIKSFGAIPTFNVNTRGTRIIDNRFRINRMVIKSFKSKHVDLFETREIRLTDITSLRYEGKNVNQEIKLILESMPNLKCLEMIEFKKCINFHSICDFKSLTHLKFLWRDDDFSVLSDYSFGEARDDNPCFECIESLINSLPNLTILCTVEAYSRSFRNTVFAIWYPLLIERINNNKSIDLKELRIEYVDTFILLDAKKLVKVQKLKVTDDSMNIKTEHLEVLFQKCPNVIEVNFHCQLSLQQFLMIEDKWPNLKYLKVKTFSAKPTPADFVDGLQGKYQRLKKIESEFKFTSKNQPQPDVKEKLFMKIPTLRESFIANYDEYCTIHYAA